MNNKDIILHLSPYPLFPYENTEETYGGVLVESNSCLTCNSKICIKSTPLKDLEFHKCEKGIVYTKVTIGTKAFLMHDIINSYSALERRKKKKISNGIFVKDTDLISKWKAQSNNLLNQIIADSEKQDSLFIHDIKKTHSSLLRSVENLIIAGCKEDVGFDKCLESSNKDLVVIFKVVSHLLYQFKLVDYISNPESASYGNLKRMHVYKALHKIIQILQNVHRIHIDFQGNSYNELYLFESFSTIFFVLLDNAIKYSLNPQSDVSVNIEDIEHNAVLVEISSYSPCIKETEKKSIFEKHFRSELSKQGQGLGLYIAKIVAEAHQTEIRLSENNTRSNKINDKMYCENTFKIILQNLDE